MMMITMMMMMMTTLMIMTMNEMLFMPNRLPPDMSQLIYSVGIREGGAMEWDYMWNKTRTTDVTTESEMMMDSLAQSQKPWLLWR